MAFNKIGRISDSIKDFNGTIGESYSAQTRATFGKVANIVHRTAVSVIYVYFALIPLLLVSRIPNRNFRPWKSTNPCPRLNFEYARTLLRLHLDQRTFELPQWKRSNAKHPEVASPQIVCNKKYRQTILIRRFVIKKGLSSRLECHYFWQEFFFELNTRADKDKFFPFS